jgi:hypothetical protein
VIPIFDDAIKVQSPVDKMANRPATCLRSGCTACVADTNTGVETGLGPSVAKRSLGAAWSILKLSAQQAAEFFGVTVPKKVAPSVPIAFVTPPDSETDTPVGRTIFVVSVPSGTG